MIDQIILSTNEDETYIDFWKPVSWAYRQMFPDVKIHLAFLTNRGEDDSLVKEFREHGEVTLFKPLPGLPEFGQAKMIRFILASRQGSDVCYIDDVDLFPLRKDFITNKTDKRPKDTLLCVGGEVYENNGCYPVSQMTAEGYLWKKFINPKDLDYPALIKSYQGTTMFDFREDVSIVPNFSKNVYFSDERLIRRLITVNPVPKFEMQRGYGSVLDETLDRQDWRVDVNKLNNHGYHNAHGIRPYARHKDKYLPLFRYIEVNYPKKT